MLSTGWWLVVVRCSLCVCYSLVGVCFVFGSSLVVASRSLCVVFGACCVFVHVVDCLSLGGYSVLFVASCSFVVRRCLLLVVCCALLVFVVDRRVLCVVICCVL